MSLEGESLASLGGKFEQASRNNIGAVRSLSLKEFEDALDGRMRRVEEREAQQRSRMGAHRICCATCPASDVVIDEGLWCLKHAGIIVNGHEYCPDHPEWRVE